MFAYGTLFRPVAELLEPDAGKVADRKVKDSNRKNYDGDDISFDKWETISQSAVVEDE